MKEKSKLNQFDNNYEHEYSIIYGSSNVKQYEYDCDLYNEFLKNISIAYNYDKIIKQF